MFTESFNILSICTLFENFTLPTPMSKTATTIFTKHTCKDLFRTAVLNNLTLNSLNSLQFSLSNNFAVCKSQGRFTNIEWSGVGGLLK